MWRNGRRARLRGVWSNPWGFKSPHRHHKKDDDFCYRLFYIEIGVRALIRFFRVQRERAEAGVFLLRVMKSRKQNTELPLTASEQDKSPHRHFIYVISK